MRYTKWVTFLVASICIIAISGCGISKDKYESILSEKIVLEEKVIALTKSKDALKNEYDNILKEKMDLATKAEVVNNEKAALKGEYDKILDEKITLKAAYDKLLAENKELQKKLGSR